jgi:GT2 family glycosyltransferase
MVGPSSASVALRERVAAPTPVVAAPSVAVVVVNFCQWHNTARLVRQLRRSHATKSGAARIVVVDNGSPSSAGSRKLEKLHDVILDRAGENLGFARGVNRGCRGVEADWILLLNPDVTVDDGFLDDALAAAEATRRDHPQTGIVGLKLKNRDGTPQPSCGAWPTLANTLTGIAAPRWRRKCQIAPGETTGQVPWATGGCLMIRRDCFAALAGFDERYFLYYEDVDFCRRAVAAGYDVRFTPAAAATHHWPLHSRPVPAPLRLITRNALLTYARTYWPRWQAWCLGRIVSLEARFRDWWARRAGNPTAAGFYRQIRTMVRDLETGRSDRVRRGIIQAAEHLVAVAAAQDGRTK